MLTSLLRYRVCCPFHIYSFSILVVVIFEFSKHISTNIFSLYSWWLWWWSISSLHLWVTHYSATEIKINQDSSNHEMENDRLLWKGLLLPRFWIPFISLDHFSQDSKFQIFKGIDWACFRGEQYTSIASYEQKCINIYCEGSEAWNEIVALWMDLIRPAASDKASL